MVDQVDFVVEVEDSVAVAVVPVLVVVVVVVAAVDGEDMILAAWKVFVPPVIVVLVFVPEERHQSVVVFRADWRVIEQRNINGG